MVHRIAFPVVSDWYQKRRSCVTIVLARSMHSKAVQHLDGHTSIQRTVELLLALDTQHGKARRRRYGRGLGVATPLTGECKASQEPCVVRSKATVAVKYSRSRISIQHHNMWETVIGCGCVKDRAFGL